MVATSGAEIASGNVATLTKVDKLRELIGTRISLPQIVAVGDQSAGKSSVLEGITGFAFPRGAELCTRYATQITCCRQPEQSVTVSIIPHQDATDVEKNRLKQFREALTDMDDEKLAAIFTKANAAMGIQISSDENNETVTTAFPAFSEHILKIEICGPGQEHFTVIDVPGIFRRETAGLTTERDINLVRKMVKKFMSNERTIILAIIPSNVDAATQEILKLAKEVDPTMTRTMGVLTKPDLNIERATQKIAIDHVTGKRSDLTMGYYIVKNRGSDDDKKSLKECQRDEAQFFAQEPWSILQSTGRAGTSALKIQVRKVLSNLIKSEFPKLKQEVSSELEHLHKRRDAMGVSRNNPQAQRALLSTICTRFQSSVRDGLDANYMTNKSLFSHDSLRLITRVLELSEIYSEIMTKQGRTRRSENELENDKSELIADAESCIDANSKDDSITSGVDSDIRLVIPHAFKQHIDGKSSKAVNLNDFPELDSILKLDDSLHVGDEDIMTYIRSMYNQSRSADLASFGGWLLASLFKEQSKNWEPLTLQYVSIAICFVHHFMKEALHDACLDKAIFETLWNDLLIEGLQSAYARAMNHAKFLLQVDQGGRPYTLNHYFNDNLQKAHSQRLTAKTKGSQVTSKDGDQAFISVEKLKNIVINKANSEHACEHIHDVLQSYYKVAMKRFVDNVFQQAVDHFLLIGDESPLKIFTPELIMSLDDEQLEMIAGEDISVKAQRDKLDADIADFKAALNVLRGMK
ncbi:uncharacterized protein JN550_002238 [Neoarthrinium moseri]|uniref:uncharacterized protein n=1 Tax=Neoarthrinium moseri TaxID=1658444 RepID=UPI001FDCBBDD|nr:uncharacterized protein JN550_002238 [Neoarthrinium moseri]KAI1874809.1 hypothetical protein JN550_002238 [Neoarthrinium moseri]